MKKVFATILGAIFIAIITLSVTYVFVNSAFDLNAIGFYKTNDLNKGLDITFFIHHKGFKTINSLSVKIEDTCNLGLYDLKIEESSSNCSLKRGINTFECNRFSMDEDILLNIKSLNAPIDNCNIEISYDFDWINFFSRLSSPIILHKKDGIKEITNEKNQTIVANNNLTSIERVKYVNGSTIIDLR